MVPRQKRLAENQQLFRHINRRLHERVSAIAQADQRIPFLCECADNGCMEPVPLTLAEYSGVREDESRFLIVPGHAMIEGENVVERSDRYAVVEKPAA